MNQVTVSWDAPANAGNAEVTHYFVEALSEHRLVKVDADTRAAVVSGLRNGVPVDVVVHAASDRGRSRPSQTVTATPTSGMEGAVAGLIVKFEPGADVAAGSTDVPGAHLVDQVALTADRELIADTRLVELSEPVSLDEARQIAADLTADPKVAWAEPDQFVHVSSTSAPDDPQYAAGQWNLWDEYGIGLGAGATRTTSAYDPGAGAGTTVAVIDTGITSHPDLDGQIVEGYDFVSDPDALAAPREDGGEPVPFDADGQSGWDADPTDPGDWRAVAPSRDSTWHGTHIAGIIAAKANNAEGISGIAPGAKVQPIRALSWRGGLMSDIAAAITWASGGTVDGVKANAKPADVINMSFAAQATCSVALQTAINHATERGSVLVAAAGNTNDDVANYAPANCSNVISVGAAGRDGKRAPYSNWGAGVDISAPGGSTNGDGGVLSTSNSGTRQVEAADYRAHEGTSIAAAHVSASIARMRGQEPGLTPAAVTTRLLGREQLRAFPAEQCDTNPAKSCGSGLLRLVQVAAEPVTVDCLLGKPGSSTGLRKPVTVSPNDQLTINYTSCSQVRWYPSAADPGALSQGVGYQVIYTAPGIAKAGVDSIRFYAQVQTTDPITGFLTIEGRYTFVDVTVAAPATPVNITLDPNGGQVTSTTISAMTGTPVTLPDPTKGTYTFAGWWTASSGGNQRLSGYSPSVTETLYARWKSTLTLDAGSGQVTPTALDVLEGQQATLPTPTRTNHRFAGWFTGTDPSVGTERVSGYVPTGSEALYAQWVPIYTVSFNGNGMTNVPPPKAIDVGAPMKVTDLPAQIPRGTHPISSFLGWYDGDDPVFEYDAATGYRLHPDFAADGGWRPGASATAGASATLTGHWTRRIAVYGPTTSTGAGSGASLCTGSALNYNPIMTSTTPTPTITLGIPNGVSAEFVSWFASRQPMVPDPSLENDTNTWVNDPSRKPTRVLGSNGELLGLRVVVDGDLPESICTSWSATTTFNPGAGTVGTTTQSGALGARLSAPAAQRPGYDFAGWYNAAVGGTQITLASDSTYYNNSSRTLHARWIAKSNTAVFDPRGGSAVSGQSWWSDQGIAEPSPPVRAGHTFIGWAESANGNPVAFSAGRFIPSTFGTVTMYAQWRANSYTAVFDSQGGSVVADQTWLSDQGIAEPPAPVRPGYTFAGWAESVNGSPVAFPFTPSTFGNVTLFARWTENSYTAVFDSQGGSAVADQTWSATQGISQPPAPQRAGFTFRGWAETVNGEVLTFPFTPSTFGNVTLYAQWEAVVVPGADPGPAPAPSATSDQPTAPQLDVPPSRTEVTAPEFVPAPERPAVMLVDGRVEVLRVERNEVNVGLDISGDGFTIAVATADVEGNRLPPAASASLVAPVRGQVEVVARGYVPDSMVSLYLIPRSSLQLQPRSQVNSYYLGEGRVGPDQTLVGEFPLPDWAGAGDYLLQINGYTDYGSVRSVNVQLDLIDVRELTTVAARVCVFPESSVRLNPECRQSLRSLAQLLPTEPTSVVLAITGVAYAQGDAAANERVAERRAKTIRQFLTKAGVKGKATIDVVTAKGLQPGFFVDPPPPVAVSAKGKPASTVMLTVTWNQHSPSP